MEILGQFNTHDSRDLQKHWIPLYSSQIACGLFGISDDFVESYLSLDEKFVGECKETTFYAKAGGDSMYPEIKAGDILIIRTSVELKTGMVGGFCLNGNMICKQFVEQNGKKILRSFQKDMRDYVLTEFDDFKVFGVVIGIAREFDWIR